MSVPVDAGGAADGALAILGAAGDACAGRRLGFSQRRAALAARFARARGGGDADVAANWLAGMLAEAGAICAVPPPGASDRERLFAAADAPLHGAHLVAELRLPGPAADAVRWHREHDDGTGFPDRLRWDGIPADAAALGICNAFLAAAEDPDEPRGPAEAVFAIVREAGRSFRVELVRAFREFVLADPDGCAASLDVALPALDEDAALAALAERIDARDDRTRGATERLAARAVPLALALGQDPDRMRRLVRLHALGRAVDADLDAVDPLSRYARERRGAEMRRAAAIAGAAARYAADAPLLAASAARYADAPSDPLAGILAAAVVIDALDPLDAPRRLAAAAGNELDPAVTQAYLAALGAAT